MQALELLQLQKGTSPDEAMLNSEEIKPVAIAIIELHWREGIREEGSESSVENSTKLRIFKIL